ncbi:MAG: Gldg family protein [Myxococcota bacterium]
MPGYLVSLSFFVGLVLIYVGERVVAPGTARTVLSLAGVGVSVAAFVWRATRFRTAVAERKVVERVLWGLMAVGLSAVVMYFAQSDALAKLGSQPLSKEWPKLAGAIAALWPAVLVSGLFPLGLMELAYAAMARAPQLELGRMRDAMFSGLGLAGVLVFSFAGMYVVTERDTKWDLSYFRTAKPGEATRNIVRALDQPLKISLFFPPANEVAEQVLDYLGDLKAESPFLEVESLDHALDAARARELSVSGNGTVVVSRGTRKELFFIGQELEKSRGQLKNLDAEVQKRLLQVARAKKTIYLTAGHGERTEDAAGGADQRATLALLRGELKAQNYELRHLSVAEGLGAEVPKDAAAVLVFGPQAAFTEPEAAALKAYFERGGRLLIALDPEPKLAFDELLLPLGLTFVPQVLANDVAYARKTHQLSDRTIIGTNTFSMHPAVSTNGRQGLPMYLMGAGQLEERKGKPTEVAVDFAVRAHASTWNDVDGNFQHDAPNETRRAFGLGAAVTRKPTTTAKAEEEGRALVLADSDAVADEILPAARGNAYFVLDGLKWLLGDEAITGTTNVEKDAPLQRTRGLDSFFFYSTMFLAPAAVVFAGYLAARRRRVKRAKEGTP